MDKRDFSTEIKKPQAKSLIKWMIPDIQGTIETTVEGTHRDCQPPLREWLASCR